MQTDPPPSLPTRPERRDPPDSRAPHTSFSGPGSSARVPLHWQSQAALLLTLPFIACYAGAQLLNAPPLQLVVWAAGVAAGLALLVFASHAGTLGATLTGALFAFTLGITPTSAHSPLWPFLAALVLTLGASRIGKKRKRAQGTVEHGGRTAAQVAANAGVAALAGSFVNEFGMVGAHVMLAAALAEMTADTLGSELGQLVPGHPRLLFSLKPVPPGTDGAVSFGGTLAGVLGAAAICGVSLWALALSPRQAGLAFGAGLAGFAMDSVLGATLERRGLLNNDAVNFLSTATAAVCSLALI